MSQVFLDTSCVIGLANPLDQIHARVRGMKSIWAQRLVTTDLVLVEVLDGLSKAQHRRTAVAMVHRLRADPAVEVVEVGRALFEQALDLYESRRDKEWGMTDCVSFVVMQSRSIAEALTADIHFQQAGFRALLRSD